MTKDADHPLWLPPLSLLVMALATWLLSFTPQALSPVPLIPFAVTGQALLLIFILRAFCYWPPMAGWIRSMPTPHKIVFALLIGGMIFGHYSFNARSHFPFIAWEIFPRVREDDPVTCREFIATTTSGKKVRLLVEQLFPSVVQIDSLDTLDDAGRYPPGTTDRLAATLAQAYSQHHTADPVKRIDLFVMSVKLHPPTGESRAQPSCQLLKRYEISSGQ